MRLLQTPRLLLEPQCVAHARPMFTLLCDPALYALENAPPPSLEWLTRRFERLESRISRDGRERWLNWVLRLRADRSLIGYVQATVLDDGRALVAYVLGSDHWGRGLAHEAVAAMLDELAERWQVSEALAVLKRANLPSLSLLRRLGFHDALPGDQPQLAIEADELRMALPLPR